MKSKDKIEAIERAGIDPFPLRCRRTRRVTDVGNGEEAVITGRIVQLDEAGGEITDGSDAIRFHGGITSPVFPHLAAGDIVEIEGRREGNLFAARDVRLLTKATRYPSDEWVRFSSLRQRLIYRARMTALIRRFFDEGGFIEVETPLLVRSPGLEPHLIAFETEYHDERKTERLYLPTSPEYAMKRLLAGGFERIFQITRAFRNGEASACHNPEFTMLEWYRAYASYEEVMDDCERMITKIVRDRFGSTTLTYGARQVTVAPPWERLTVRDAFRQCAGIDLNKVAGVGEFRRVARMSGFDEVRDDDPWETIFFKIFLNAVEPRLGLERPTFLTDYPLSMAALAKPKRSLDQSGEPMTGGNDMPVAERFEVYIAGLELANGFTELNDPREQHRRFLEEQEEKRRIGLPVYPVDEAFVAAMEGGIPPAGGIALGIDRLVMLMTDAQRISEVIAFPFQV